MHIHVNILPKEISNLLSFKGKKYFSQPVVLLDIKDRRGPTLRGSVSFFPAAITFPPIRVLGTRLAPPIH